MSGPVRRSAEGSQIAAPEVRDLLVNSASVCVCILNWNGWRDTIECLESVLRSDFPAFQVVVIDNGSTDGSLDRIKEWAAGARAFETPPDHPLAGFSTPPVSKPVQWAAYPLGAAPPRRSTSIPGAPLVLIDAGGNHGFAAGMNVGLRYALSAGRFGHVWLLNNDTVVSPDSLSHLLAKFASQPRLGLCGATLLYYDEPERVQALGGFRHNMWAGTSSHIGQDLPYDATAIDEAAVEARMHGVQGASMLVSASFLLEVGLLTEDYFLYFEEHDWAARAKRAGFRFGYAAGSRVYHKEGRSTGGTRLMPQQRSITADFYQLQSRILFTRRFYPYALPSVYAGLVIAALNRLRRGQYGRLPMIAGIVFRSLFGRPRRAAERSG